MRRETISIAAAASRITLGAGLVVGLALGLQITGAMGAEFPSKEIQVISHASPGGGTDTTARMMMIRARRILAKGIKKFKNSGAPMNTCSSGPPTAIPCWP